MIFAERMARLGIHTGADLRACERAFLEQHFGKFAVRFCQKVGYLIQRNNIQ